MSQRERNRDAERELARHLGVVARRAIWRLDLIEWVILLGAAAVAAGGGALLAPLLTESLGISFRWAWIGLSVFLFAVPGAIVLLRLSREEAAARKEAVSRGTESHEHESADV